MISIERLKEILTYLPDRGVFIWNETQRGGRAYAGDVAGNLKQNGYWHITIDGKKYYAHRLAIFWMTGKWPLNPVDHANGKRDDNRWCNLRVATCSENLANNRPRKSYSGLKGAILDSRRGTYQARVQKDGKVRIIGSFDCPAAAHFAYQIEADKLFGQFARWR